MLIFASVRFFPIKILYRAWVPRLATATNNVKQVGTACSRVQLLFLPPPPSSSSSVQLDEVRLSLNMAAKRRKKDSDAESFKHSDKTAKATRSSTRLATLRSRKETRSQARSPLASLSVQNVARADQEREHERETGDGALSEGKVLSFLFLLAAWRA